jgi:glycosyltransferase involved in cell wall biosynthesis
MKILYITLEDLSLHKGSVIHIKEVVSGLRKRGHQVGLIGRASIKSQDFELFYNIHHSAIFPLKLLDRRKVSYFISSIFLFLYLFKVLPQYDVIYARDYHTVVIAHLHRVIFNKRLVFEINGLANEEERLKGSSIFRRFVSFFIGKGEEMATKWSDRIVSVTPQIAHYLTQHFDCRPDKVKVINNGVDTEEFHPVDDPALLANIRKSLGIEKSDAVVAFVGNLAHWQGVEYLIQVAPELVGEVKNVKFLIVGDGILRNKIETEVNQSGMSHYFVITGMVEHSKIPLYINIADICVLFKRKLASGFSPLKLYEYMACGKPILATRVEGLEFIEKEGIGRLIEPDNPGKIMETLCEMIKDREDSVNMGLRGLRLAVEKFSWESKVIEIERILEALG